MLILRISASLSTVLGRIVSSALQPRDILAGDAKLRGELRLAPSFPHPLSLQFRTEGLRRHCNL